MPYNTIAIASEEFKIIFGKRERAGYSNLRLKLSRMRTEGDTDWARGKRDVNNGREKDKCRKTGKNIICKTNSIEGA